MKTLKSCLAALTIAGLFSGIAGQATGSPLTPDVTKAVRTADLDLTKPEDIQALYDRIRGTARSLCETEHSAPWDLKRNLHKRRCFDQAVERAVGNADLPLLTALHRGARDRVAGL